jgi:adenylate kinase
MYLQQSRPQPSNAAMVGIERHPAIALLGAPGAGKGTQGRILNGLPGFFLYGAGDAFRALDPDSPLGRRVHDPMRRGELVPDSVVIEVWSDYLRQAIDHGRYVPGRDLLVLDGLPRTVEQVDLVEQRAELLTVLHLKCDNPSRLVERLRCRALEEGRADDVDERVIRHRFDLYEAATRPVLARLSGCAVAEIDALAPPLEVLRQILQAVIPLQAGEW